LDGALSTLGWGNGSLPVAGGWNWVVYKVPPNPNHSMIQSAIRKWLFPVRLLTPGAGIPERQWRFGVLGDTQKPPGHGPELPAVADPAASGFSPADLQSCRPAPAAWRSAALLFSLPVELRKELCKAEQLRRIVLKLPFRFLQWKNRVDLWRC